MKEMQDGLNWTSIMITNWNDIIIIIHEINKDSTTTVEKLKQLKYFDVVWNTYSFLECLPTHLKYFDIVWNTFIFIEYLPAW